MVSKKIYSDWSTIINCGSKLVLNAINPPKSKEENYRSTFDADLRS